MKQKSIHLYHYRWKLEIVAMLISSLLGALFHFTYQWSGNSPAVAWFSAIDESVMSHLCLLNIPWLLMTIFIYVALKKQKQKYTDVIFSRAMGLLVAIASICVIFYSYTLGNTRASILSVDIITFIIAIILGGITSVLISHQLEVRQMKEKEKSSNIFHYTGLVIYSLITIWLIIFGYWKPSTTSEPFALPPSET
jgi:MFS family permease